MGLITNGHRNAFSPFKWMNGNLLTIQNGAGVLRTGYLPGNLHNWQLHAERQTALPTGNLHPYGWLLPRTGGGMSLRTEGAGSLAANLIPTVNGAIDFTGTGDLDATAALVISMLCDMTGSGSLTTGIVGLLNMSIDLDGDGDLAASLSGIGNMLIDLEGSGSIDAAIAAYGNMDIDIVVTGTGLSTANVGAAVWNALSASFDTAGTMGEKLNDAGSASNPWSDTTDYGPGTKGQLLEDAAAGGGGGGGTIIRDDELAQGGTKSTIILNSAASSTDNLYEEAYVVLISGTGAGQVRKIKSYFGGSKTATVINNFQVAPDATTVYRIIP